jgi:hypothetical protein
MKKKADDRELHNKTDYQQGFSAEGAALLARLWIKPEEPINPTDYTLASYINSSQGYKHLDHNGENKNDS